MIMNKFCPGKWDANGMPILVGYPKQSTEEKLLGLISPFSVANGVGSDSWMKGIQKFQERA